MFIRPPVGEHEKEKTKQARATVRGLGPTVGGRSGGLRETKEDEEREGWAVLDTATGIAKISAPSRLFGGRGCRSEEV
jgi:hypothetical protein